MKPTLGKGGTVGPAAVRARRRRPLFAVLAFGSIDEILLVGALFPVFLPSVDE